MDKTKTVLLVIFFAFLAWSCINPHDYFTWFLEVIPAILALLILSVTYTRFPFSNFIYLLICVHALVLMVGGHYTYAEVPFGYWMKEAFNFSRNHYDRIGHFAQGFVPALVVREVVIRRKIIRGEVWQYFFITAAVLGFSALYELFEWGTALATGEAANAFLGTQGDAWDTQWDMFMCLIGALTALIIMSKVQDNYLKEQV